MSTEWLCRGCEVSVDKMMIQREMILPRVSETGHVIEGSPQVLYTKEGKCERCGQVRRVFEYERTERPAEEVLSEALEIAKEVAVEAIIEALPDADEVMEAETVEEPAITDATLNDKIEEAIEAEPEPVEEPDPYKGLTKDDLVALLKEKTENE